MTTNDMTAEQAHAIIESVTGLKPDHGEYLNAARDIADALTRAVDFVAKTEQE